MSTEAQGYLLAPSDLRCRFCRAHGALDATRALALALSWGERSEAAVAGLAGADVPDLAQPLAIARRRGSTTVSARD